jgi:hypothetical protein
MGEFRVGVALSPISRHGEERREIPGKRAEID